MSAERIAAAMKRIERSLGRIETAVRSAPASSPPPDPQLAARHERLRANVRESLEALDALITAEAAR